RPNPVLVSDLVRDAALPRRLDAGTGVAREAVRIVEIQLVVKQRSAELEERFPYAATARDVPLAREEHRARIRIAGEAVRHVPKAGDAVLIRLSERIELRQNSAQLRRHQAEIAQPNVVDGAWELVTRIRGADVQVLLPPGQ